MLGIQVGICFAIWIGFGYFVFRKSQQKSVLNASTRSKKIALATAILFGSGGVLLVSLFALQLMGGIANGSLTYLAWIVVGVVGCLFVGLQVLAIDLLLGILLETVTPVVTTSSDGKEGNSE